MKSSGLPEPAVAYLRVSDKKQLNTAIDIDPDGNSIATQRETIEKRAHTLPANIVKEFVEPGVSGQSIEKRPAFQQMLDYLREHPEVRYVIVYMRSRAFRNYIDAAITKRQLDLMGVQLISAKEDFGQGIYADMMAAITDIFNDTQNRLSGQDISTKMLHKAMNGGTCGRAKIGYINARVDIEGRQVNTIRIDPERGPLVVRAWELYATGDYTIEDLEATMADLGLTSRPSGRHPVARPVSAGTLHTMLSDPYYVGYVEWKGETYPGRHEPLIGHDLFERVQEVLRHRSANGSRDRVHNHYLKGGLFCTRCRDNGETSRLVYSKTTGRNGTRYAYFVCRRSQAELCDLPSLPVEMVEDAIVEHYRALQLPADFVTETRALLTGVLDDEQANVREMHSNLNRQLKELASKESRLIDLVADGTIPKDKVRAKLLELENQRKRIQAGLVDTSEQLALGVNVLRQAIDLIADPYALYRDAGPETRRLLNETFYERLYIDDRDDTTTTPRVAADRTPIFADLHRAARTCRSGASGIGQKRRPHPHKRTGAGSNKALAVVPAGIEPATSRV
ncbi:recombinase family protein [Nocardia aurantia]|uniref:recombinase family protein n=1 Tax=Nocardia aurantia TaxID=2585199 RepID=UPI00387343CB